VVVKRRRGTLSREVVLAEAMKLADAEGVAALTMRLLARRLGVEAMSLYHHFPNKEAILGGMVERVFELVPVARGADWKRAMRRRAHALRGALAEHAWALGMLDSRRDPGPATLRHHDAAIACLRRAGFSIRLTAHALALLDSYTFGFVAEERSLPISGPDEIREVSSEALRRMGDAYPHLAELATRHVMKPGYAFGDEFGWGLELILDGLERRRAG
jgi:AcrR family transcriptional regulator